MLRRTWRIRKRGWWSAFADLREEKAVLLFTTYLMLDTQPVDVLKTKPARYFVASRRRVSEYTLEFGRKTVARYPGYSS
jgi:hypothetical protein